MQIKNGFSLIELLIVLSIITIISAIGMTSLVSFQQKSQQQILISQLLRAIQLTRSEAITHNKKMILCNSVDQKTCSGHWQDGFIIKTAEQILHVFQSFSVNGQLHWRAFPLDREALEFLPAGLPNAENGTFWFCSSEARNPAWAIILNKAGRARVMYANAQGAILDHKGMPLRC